MIKLASHLSCNLVCQRRISNAFHCQSSVQSHNRLDFDSLVSTLITASRSCSSVSYLGAFHARVIKSLNYRHGFLGDILVSAYTELDCAEIAQKLFDEMPDKDLVSWNSLISGFSRRGYVDKCLLLIRRMRYESHLLPNEVTVISTISACTDMKSLDEGKIIHGFALKLGMLWEAKVINALINLYGKFRLLTAACRLFETSPVHNLVSWNSIITIHSQNGCSQEGIKFFLVMRRKRYEFDQATLVSVLQACEDLGIGKLAETIHGLILSCGLNSDVKIATSLLNLYAKLGKLYASRDIFKEIINPDSIAWTAMLAGYAVHGYGREAVELFELMVKQAVMPDHVTFTHLLSACSHSGLVKQGWNYFKSMSQVYGVKPRLDHYSCMVDLLGRSGLLEDAYELIKNMPVEPNSAVLGALLNACRIYHNIQIGKEVAERLIVLDPLDPRNYIMLSNIYSAAGFWRDASKVRALMKKRGLTQNPGCSFIEYGNKLYQFVVDDRSHPESEKIHKKLEEVIGKIRDAGFESKTEFVLHDVDEEVKEEMINKHGEKLAIAFGLLVTNPGVPLIITKNLRICGDCHSTAKLVSLVENRTIVIRDSKRFHHFAEGLCSCGDYW